MIFKHLYALGTYCMGDFNKGIEEQHIKGFCNHYNLTSLIKQPTCQKNPKNPTCFDLILSNTARSFQNTIIKTENSTVIGTGLSDFYLMALTVMKKSFRIFQPRLISYRSYRNLSNQGRQNRGGQGGHGPPLFFKVKKKLITIIVIS